MPSDTIYNHETVALDGEIFSDCEFRDSRLAPASVARAAPSRPTGLIKTDFRKAN